MEKAGSAKSGQMSLNIESNPIAFLVFSPRQNANERMETWPIRVQPPLSGTVLSVEALMGKTKPII